MATNLKDIKNAKMELYIPNDAVVALAGLRCPNKGVHHEESEYVNHGLKILDSFVDRTNNVINNIQLV